MIGTGSINNNPTFNWIKSLERGTIFAYSSNGTAPDGALICNGAEISRTTYKLLFDVIGTTYGPGNGTTTFNLPDLTYAHMITSDLIGVMGNGMSLGLTNGSANLSFNVSGADNNSKAYSPSAFNITPRTGSVGDVYTYGVFGVVQDVSTSGLKGTASLSVKLDYYIKY